MSLAWYIVVDGKPGFDTFVSGKALARRGDLDAAARALGVRPLSEFVHVPDEEIDAALGEPTPLRPEVVAKLGLRKEPGFFYYLKGSEVWRKARKQPEEKVTDGGFVRESDADWLYFIDGDGDVVRTPKQPAGRAGEPFFAAEAGLATVRALRAHFAALADAAPVVADLDAYEKVLAQAAAKGLRFRLGVDL